MGASPIWRIPSLIDGLKYKAAVGLTVDQQQINVAARSTDIITGGALLLPGAARRFVRRLRDRPLIWVFFSRSAGRYGNRRGDAVQGAAWHHLMRSAAPAAPRSRSIPIWCCSTSTCRAICISRRACTRFTDPGYRFHKSDFQANGTVGAGSDGSSIIYWPLANANFAQGNITRLHVSAFLAGVTGGDGWLRR